MRFTRLKEECVTRSHFGHAIFVANVAAAGNDEIKLRFRRMRMIRAKRFAFRNPDQREIERMPLREIERLRLAPKRDGNFFVIRPNFPFGDFRSCSGTSLRLTLRMQNQPCFESINDAAEWLDTHCKRSPMRLPCQKR